MNSVCDDSNYVKPEMHPPNNQFLYDKQHNFIKSILYKNE